MLHTQRFPQDSWEAAGIIFLGRFLLSWTKRQPEFPWCLSLSHMLPHSSLHMCAYRPALLQDPLTRHPVLLALGVSIWLGHLGPFELKSFFNLGCLVPRNTARKDSAHPVFLVGSFLFLGNK